MIPEDGCCSVRFMAVQRGHTTVTASYTARGTELTASVTIAAYDPLMVKTCNLAFKLNFAHVFCEKSKILIKFQESFCLDN